MKAIVIHQYGGPGVLKFEETPDPVAGPGAVVVRVAAASINPIDIIERSGAMKDFRPMTFPNVLGWDLAGTIVSVGPQVQDFSLGDKVLAWGYHTYAELCAVKAELLAKVPAGLDLVEAAALPLVTTTGAELILVAGGVKAGQTVLVSGASGAVGRSAVFTAKERGAKVIAGVRKSQMEAAKSLGADQVAAIDDEDALNRIADERIGLEAIAVGAAGGHGRLGEQREIGVGELVAGLKVRGLISRHRDRVRPRPPDDRRAGENAVEVLGKILGFNEPLLTARRAAGVIGALGVRAIKRLRDLLAGDGRLVGPQHSPVFPLISDEGVAVERGRRRRPEICLRGGVSAPDRGFHGTVIVGEHACVAAVAVDVEDALPPLVRHP